MPSDLQDPHAIYFHVRIVLGMVVSLGLAHLLRGVARIVENPAPESVYWIHLVWVAFLFLFMAHFWWWELLLTAQPHWMFGVYLFLILYALLLYLLATLLFPEVLRGSASYREHFYARRAWFFGGLALAYAIDLYDTRLKGGAYFQNLGTEYLVRNAAFVALCAAAIPIRSERFHGGFAVGALLYQLSWIWRRYATLAVAGIAVIVLSVGSGCSTHPGQAAPEPPAAPPRPYVFAWPFLDTPMQPRGGTTRGADVTLAAEPSEAWQKLQAPGLAARERDRAAILAMAGDYRVSFDFLETILFTPGAKPARPYRSWATERVYVLADRADFVSLQHILVMLVVDEQGKTQGPFVQKHWRQDWRYEPRDVLAYAGDDRFETRAVPAAARRGAWSQTVYQVDDAPRYGSLGRWAHSGEASIWEGGDAWRPLPRREHTVRSDYQVLAGRNRHTILPTGWVHEQDNLKLVLADGRTRKLAREMGVDRYERIQGFDFSAADAYWNATSGFWSLVRDGWAKRTARDKSFRVATSCNGEEGFVPFFRTAGRLEAGEAVSAAEQRAEVDRALDCVVSRD